MEKMMNNPAPDYAAFVGAESADGGELSALSKLAEEQAQAEAHVADLEAQLAKATERLKDLSDRQVPELMDQIGIEEFRTSTGLFIKVKEDVRAYISQERSAEALAWLREHNHASLIKRTVSIQFGRGEDEVAETVRQNLTEQGFLVDDKSAVHNMTLRSFVREQLRTGIDIPFELFGVERLRSSVIK
jgi:hypothetical protein